MLIQNITQIATESSAIPIMKYTIDQNGVAIMSPAAAIDQLDVLPTIVAIGFDASADGNKKLAR